MTYATDARFLRPAKLGTRSLSVERSGDKFRPKANLKKGSQKTATEVSPFFHMRRGTSGGSVFIGENR
jgi:hypothetical protein